MMVLPEGLNILGTFAFSCNFPSGVEGSTSNGVYDWVCVPQAPGT